MRAEIRNVSLRVLAGAALVAAALLLGEVAMALVGSC